MEPILVGGKEYTPAEVLEHLKKAAGSFRFIAAFSLLNSVLLFFEANVSFAIGLGATMVVDVLFLGARDELQGAEFWIATAVLAAVYAGIIGAYLLIWWFACRGSLIAYIGGMVLYLLDTSVFLLGGDLIGIGIHVFFLFLLWGGLGFVKQAKVAISRLNPPLDPALATETFFVPENEPPLFGDEMLRDSRRDQE